jgi:hypothetical protein
MTSPEQPLDFNAFVLSLGSSAFIHLGLAPDPTGREPGVPTGREQGPPTEQSLRAQINLPLAQQSIDLLALLQEKTRGNLTPEEKRFLDDLLFELRMRYVEVARAVGAKAG